jgi:hypothetical protein
VILDASAFEHWDRCRRLGIWSQSWVPARVTPLGAVYDALHKVMAMEANAYTGPGMARELVMQAAGERGVETDRQDPYAVMVHHAHLAEVLARVLRKPADGPWVRPKSLELWNMDVDWQPQAYLMAGGMRLLRFVLVDHWDDDRQMAELHGWRTIGDVCATGLPMTLRILVIGQSHSGLRHGHWTRARQHPRSKLLRFARKHSKADGFAESWLKVWREDTRIGPDAWIEQMARDEVLREAAFDRQVSVPGEYARGKVLDDIQRIGAEMQGVQEGTGPLFPMNRSACDSPMHGPCRYQNCCYALTEMTPGETGMFERKAKGER